MMREGVGKRHVGWRGNQVMEKRVGGQCRRLRIRKEGTRARFHQDEQSQRERSE